MHHIALRSVVRLWAIFRGTVPASVLALLPPATVDTLMTDEYGGRRSRLITQFAVLDSHPQSMLSFRRCIAERMSLSYHYLP